MFSLLDTARAPSLEQTVEQVTQPENSRIIPELDFSYVRHRLVNTFAFSLSDALALGLALLAAGAIRLWIFGDPLISSWSWGVIPLWWSGAALTRLLPGWGLGPVEEFRRCTLLLFAVYAGLAIILFLSKQAEEVSRLTITAAFLVSLFAVPYARVWTRRLLITGGHWGVPVAVYGAGETGKRIIQLLRQEKGLGYDPVVVYSDNTEVRGERLAGMPVLGGAEQALPSVPVAILAMPEASYQRQIDLLEGPLLQYRTTLVIPELLEAPSLWVQPRDLSGILGLTIKHNLSSPLACFLKRGVDVLLVLATIPLWGPLCLVLAALIWYEDGESPFFRQERVGWGGRHFRALKFRTMVPNAEEVLRQRLDNDEALRHEWERSYKLKDDPRITRIGKVLRRFSLDELPQLVNVLRGEMALVGPRPLPEYHHMELPDRVRRLRKHTWPGITGLWQVNGRSDTGTEGMERWDSYYVRNWSLWLDAVILVRTVRAVIWGSGAY